MRNARRRGRGHDASQLGCPRPSPPRGLRASTRPHRAASASFLARSLAERTRGRSVALALRCSPEFRLIPRTCRRVTPSRPDRCLGLQMVEDDDVVDASRKSSTSPPSSGGRGHSPGRSSADGLRLPRHDRTLRERTRSHERQAKGVALRRDEAQAAGLPAAQRARATLAAA